MNRKRVSGVYVVEFAILGLLLFVLLFGVLEVGRLLFTVNTLNESVRRGARLAAVCQIQDPVILRRAVFAEVGKATSSIIGNLDTADLVLSYLDANGAPVKSPDSTGFGSIRFVEVSIRGFQFNLLIPVVGRGITLQLFRSVLPRESLGSYPEGTESTPC